MERTAGFISFLHRQTERSGLLQTSDEAGTASPVRLLTILVLLALLVRGVMALLLTSVCDDAHYYMSLSKALTSGDVTRVLGYLNLNIYPLILAGLSQLGGGWMMAAKLWGVIISSLAVLPLYGFVRRAFDARTAAAAGVLYVLHPGLIELSVEPVREPTFWFLFLSGLYLAWRSAEDRSWSLFLLNGVVTALAIHTRTEGWLLVPALLYWAALKGWECRSLRGRLGVGTGLCLLVTPLLILTVNVTLLRNHSRWELGRMDHVRMGVVWLSSLTATAAGEPDESSEQSETAASSAPVPAAAGESQRGRKSAEVASAEAGAGRLAALPGYVATYFRAVSSSIEPLYLLLTAFGLYCGRQQLLERRRIMLSLMAAAVMLAVCAYAGFTIVSLKRMQINDRYFFTVLLVYLPFTATGLLAGMDWLQQQEWFLSPHQQRRMLIAPACLGVLLITGTADAWSSRHGKREDEARLGAWLGENYGPVESVVANTAGIRAGYFVNGRLPDSQFSHGSLQVLVSQKQPELVIIGTRRLQQPDRDALIESLAQSASPPLQRAVVPEEFSEFVVLQSARLVARQTAKNKAVQTAAEETQRSVH